LKRTRNQKTSWVSLFYRILSSLCSDALLFLGFGIFFSFPSLGTSFFSSFYGTSFCSYFCCEGSCGVSFCSSCCGSSLFSHTCFTLFSLATCTSSFYCVSASISLSGKGIFGRYLLNGAVFFITCTSVGLLDSFKGEELLTYLLGMVMALMWIFYTSSPRGFTWVFRGNSPVVFHSTHELWYALLVP